MRVDERQGESRAVVADGGYPRWNLDGERDWRGATGLRTRDWHGWRSGCRMGVIDHGMQDDQSASEPESRGRSEVGEDVLSADDDCGVQATISEFLDIASSSFLNGSQGESRRSARYRDT
jgi:hypothetical protein